VGGRCREFRGALSQRGAPTGAFRPVHFTIDEIQNLIARFRSVKAIALRNKLECLINAELHPFGLTFALGSLVHSVDETFAERLTPRRNRNSAMRLRREPLHKGVASASDKVGGRAFSVIRSGTKLREGLGQHL